MLCGVPGGIWPLEKYFMLICCLVTSTKHRKLGKFCVVNLLCKNILWIHLPRVYQHEKTRDNLIYSTLYCGMKLLDSPILSLSCYSKVYFTPCVIQTRQLSVISCLSKPVNKLYLLRTNFTTFLHIVTKWMQSIVAMPEWAVQWTRLGTSNDHGITLS